MKLVTCMSLATAIVIATAERAPLRFSHVHPRQYYAPPPPYSPPVTSSTFTDDFPPPTSSFPATGIPSSTGIPLSSSPANSSIPTSSGLWNSTTIRSTVIVTSRVVITVTPSSSVPVVTSTKLVTVTSCKLTNEGVISCTDLSPSSTSRPTTGTFTDATSVSFGVDTSTSIFGPPISFPTSVSMPTGMSLSTGPPSIYLPSTTPPYGNGTSSTYSWGTGTAPPASSTFTSPSNATTSSGYYGPPAPSSTPSWDTTSSTPTDTLTLPTNTSTESTPTPSSTSWSYTWPSYSYSSYSPSESSTYLTTPTPSSRPIYFSSYSSSVPDVPSSITFDFPSGSSFSFSIPTPSSSLGSSSSSYFSITLTASSSSSSTRSSSSTTFSSRTFPPWPPVFSATSSPSPSASSSSISFLPPLPSSSSIFTPSFSFSLSSTVTTNTLSDSIPTSFDSSTKSEYAAPPTPTRSFTFTDATFSSWSDPPPTSAVYPPYTPAPRPTTFTDATFSSWDLATSAPTPSTLSTLVGSSATSAEESETGAFYGPVAPSLSARDARVKAWNKLAKRQGRVGDPAKLKMSEDGVSWMRDGRVGARTADEDVATGSEDKMSGERVVGPDDVEGAEKKSPVSIDLLAQYFDVWQLIGR